MQTAKDKTIVGMLKHLGGLTPTEKRVAEMAYDAGYRAAREDAAKKAEQYLRMEENRPATGQRVAAEIRKLEPSNLASEQETANSRQD